MEEHLDRLKFALEIRRTIYIDTLYLQTTDQTGNWPLFISDDSVTITYNQGKRNKISNMTKS